MIRRSLLAAAILALVGGIALADAAAQHARSSSGSLADWKSADEILDEVGLRRARVRATLLSIPDSGADAIVVRANEVALSGSEVDAIEAFARSGGRVIVLAEPTLAARFGMEIAPVPIHANDGGALRAEGDAGPLLPGARPLLGAGEVVLATRSDSFVDADRDGRASASDVAGPFAVGRMASEGRVLVLSTTLLADAEALADPTTRAYVRELFAELLPPGSLVALDDTRAAADPGTALVASGVRAGELTAPRAVLVGAALALALLAWPSRASVETREEQRTRLREEQA